MLILAILGMGFAAGWAAQRIVGGQRDWAEAAIAGVIGSFVWGLSSAFSSTGRPVPISPDVDRVSTNVKSGFEASGVRAHSTTPRTRGNLVGVWVKQYSYRL